jgi:drug/metabolite transporter (DMT)-like permease
MTTVPMTRLKANALLLLAALIWGSAFVGQALGMADVGPLGFTGLRFVLGMLVVAPLAWREWQALRAAGQAPGPAEARWIALLGCLLCTGVVMQQVGLITTSVTNAGFLTALYVPVVPLLAWGFQRQLPHWSVWPAAAGCLLGTWLLTGASLQSLGAGDLWLLASALPWAVHVLLVGQVANKLRGAYVLACGQFAVCAVISSALALATESITAAGLQAAAGAIAYTGILSVGVGFTLQVVGQRHAHAADAAIILSSETVFAALFGAWFMGDRLSSAGLAGCALILACILAVQVLPLLTTRPATT